MNIQIDLLRRVQAGDPVAAQALVERYQPIVYRLVLSIFDSFQVEETEKNAAVARDLTLDAADASREALTTALSRVDELSEAADFSAWLTRLVVQTCLMRFKRRRTHEWLERLKQAILHPGKVDLVSEKPAIAVTGRSDDLWQTFISLAELDRVALVLRYDHHMLPHEIVLAMGGRERALQARLHAAREKLWRAWAQAQNLPVELEDEHAHYARLIQSAADHQITDHDAAELAGHLKGCAGCQASLRQFDRLEKALESMFHERLDARPTPPLDISRAALDLHRHGHAGRNAFNLVGGAVVTLIVVAAVIELPNILPSAPIPALASSTPTANATPGRAFTPRPTPVTPPNDPELAHVIYPGKLAFSTGVRFGNNQGTSGHLMTMLPNGSEMKSLDVGSIGVTSPAWSPDGTQIAYLGYQDGSTSNEVFVALADGSNARQISPSSFVKNDQETINGTPQVTQVRFPTYGAPQWSPDGRYVAVPVWLSPEESSLQIFSLNGRPARELSVPGLDPTPIKWSPDGRSIAYINASGSALWLWNPNRAIVDGVNPRHVELQPSWDTTLGLDWSPDSKQLALLTAIDNTPPEINLFILKMDGPDYKFMPISDGVVQRGRIRSSGLAWSPDGRYLAISLALRDSGAFSNRLMLMQPSDNVLQTLVNMERGVRDFTWSPDGRWVAFTSGFEVWAASLNAFENSQVHLVKLGGMAGSQLSWQTVR